MSQQDHKISSMVSLISSLAEESQQNNNPRGGFISSPAVPLVVSSSSSLNNIISNNLIHVSDDEEDSESESEFESDSESGSDSGSDSDDDKSDTDDVKTITILSEDLAKEDTSNIIFEENDEDENHENEENNDDEENDDADDNSLFEMDELQFEQPDSVVQEDNAPASHEDVKSIHLDQPSVDEITDFSIFKTINISSLDESTINGDNNNGDNNNNTKVFETSDYKKMSITRLREIISKQGVSDASKLKKNDILKMLGVE